MLWDILTIQHPAYFAVQHFVLVTHWLSIRQPAIVSLSLIHPIRFLTLGGVLFFHLELLLVLLGTLDIIGRPTCTIKPKHTCFVSGFFFALTEDVEVCFCAAVLLSKTVSRATWKERYVAWVFR
jgi:hypothetical protein